MLQLNTISRNNVNGVHSSPALLSFDTVTRQDMTRIRDHYAQLDSTYMMNQPHNAARALEMILQSNSGRSERACNIHSKCQCHPVVPGREPN